MIEDFTGDYGLLDKLFKHKRDYKLEEYVSQDIPFFEDELLQRFESEVERDRRLERKFSYFIGSLFDFKYFEEVECNVLQYSFGTLNARKKTLLFPPLFY